MGNVSRTQVVKYIRKGDKGDPGAKGEQGAVMRGPQAWSDCEIGYAFQAGGEGEQWKDVVLYNGNYYSCVKTHTKIDASYPGGDADNNFHLWQLGDKIELVAANLLLANYSLIKNLGAEAIEMKNSAGETVFLAKDGNITCKTGTFENVNINGKLVGSVRNPFDIPYDSVDVDYCDNVTLFSLDYSLPWDVRQSGRRITLAHFYWDNTLPEDIATSSAPSNSGMYFYEDGVRKSQITISRQAVELLGYGTTTTFYGWIVMRRVDLMTKNNYGRQLKALAIGSVTSDGVLTYKTFDGSTLTCTKQSPILGHYTITMPSGWFSNPSHCHVLLTGIGSVDGQRSELIKASLLSRTKTEFKVGTSCGVSLADGAFDFVIINNNDWLYK